MMNTSFSIYNGIYNVIEQIQYDVDELRDGKLSFW